LKLIIKKRHPLSSKEQKELLEEVRDKYPFVYEVLDRKRPIELLETSKGEVVFICRMADPSSSA